MTVDLGPAAQPRRIPTQEERMNATDRIPVDCIRIGCVDQHHHMDGDTADARSQDRALREALTERDEARRINAAQAAQLRRLDALLACMRDLDEQRDRAWADHDTAPGGRDE